MGIFDGQFDDIMQKTRDSFAGMEPRAWAAAEAEPWPDAAGANIMGGFDAALEMGGSLLRGASFLCATTNPDADIDDRVVLYGPDLGELGARSPYGRITLMKLRGEGLGERDMFNAMLDLDISKHRVDPAGFAISYPEASRYEAVKVSRGALRDGVSFANIGASYIRRYKLDSRVLAVTEIFVTDPAYDYEAAEELGRRVQKTMVAMRAHSIMPRTAP